MNQSLHSPHRHRRILAVVGVAALRLAAQDVRTRRRARRLAALDPTSYEQVLWVYNTRRGSVRCLLVNRATVPAAREGAILELCARINEDLVFGCAEYSFGDRTVIFRDSVQLGSGDTGDLLTGATARVLDLGSRYAPAVRATLAGSSPVEAMSHAGDPREEPGRKESAN